MNKEDLQISLEAHEQWMEKRSYGKANTEIALQARFNEKDKKLKGKWPMKSKENF